jgi:hypothetical protein
MKGGIDEWSLAIDPSVPRYYPQGSLVQLRDPPP